MNKENDMTLMTTPESQQELMNRLFIAETALTQFLLFPDSPPTEKHIDKKEDAFWKKFLLNSRQADYDEAYAAYNDFLDDKILSMIQN
jgi:hypothetical protein